MDKLILELLEEADREIIKVAQNKLSQRLKDLYTYFLRPKTGGLLRILNLDLHYEDGFRNYLIAKDEQGRENKYLDMTGGYGANLLGHKNPVIINTLINAANNLAPSHTQASLRKVSSLLGREISSMLEEEAKAGPWITTFSNSGTEAVEAAIKICLKRQQERKEKLAIQNTFQRNFIKKYIKNLDEAGRAQLKIFVMNFAKDMIKDPDLSLEVINEMLYQYNEHILSRPIKLAALKGSYHGKTLGSLDLTHNEGFKAPFGLKSNTVFLDLENIEDETKKCHRDFFFLDPSGGHLNIVKQPLNDIAGIFIEPIQGEGGIVEVDPKLLTRVREICDEQDILMVSDEIQSGLYRMGKLAALSDHNIAADIYTFSKGLGGGVAKIAATVCLQDKYPIDFGYLHTSTFAEDDISSSVALKVLEILKRDKDNFHKVDLIGELKKLQSKYPHLVKEVRGKGYMAAIEFSREGAARCHEFMIFDQIGFLGYFYASAILNNEKIRTTPSLSNGRTLRLQPSLFFAETEMKQLVDGLENFLKALDKADMNYFFSHIYPGEELKKPTIYPPDVYSHENTGRPMAVFFCHMITPDHARTLVTSHAKISDPVLRKKLSKVSDILDFSLLHREVLKKEDGEEVDLVFMAHPITSEELVKMVKSGRSDEMVDKLQRGIDFVKDLGATTVGLGQFTSIISLNGLKLDNRGLNLTTGNAYTTAMTVKAAIKAAKDKEIDFKKSNIACVGMAGNIVSVTASLISDHAQKMTFIYHTDLKDSLKYQLTLKRFFKDVLKSDKDSPFNKSVKEIASRVSPEKEFLNFVNELVKEEVLYLSKDTKALQQCEVVLTGASAPKPFITADDLAKNALVVDIGVPPNVNKKSLSSRKDILYIQGGLAKLPLVDGEVQAIKTSAFPLKPGTSYACLGETIVLTMAGKSNVQNIGELSKEMVQNIEEIAESVGFDLAEYKQEDSL